MKKKTGKEGFTGIKVDMAKAYDSIEWNFLINVFSPPILFCSMEALGVLLMLQEVFVKKIFFSLTCLLLVQKFCQDY